MDKDKYTALRAEFIFGETMSPCPKCHGFNLHYKTPIQFESDPTKSASQNISKWANVMSANETPLKGPVYIECFDCHHRGPSLDCTGRTRQDVGADEGLARTVRRLWNEQPRNI
jgi:hypothetical protein